MTTIFDLINTIKQNDNLTSIINTYKTESEKGFIFERLWDIIIKFGFCDRFQNTKYKHIVGNVNEGKCKILTSITKYINETKIISGNSSGYSDITLYDLEKDRYIFITCKYFTKKEDIKTVDKYDIQKILAVIKHNENIYKNSEIYVLVNNKLNVLKRVQKANESSKLITKYMTENNILDMEDLNKYYQLFRQSIQQHNVKDYDDIYDYGKTNLEKRFHQELIVRKTKNLIDEGNKQFLWGCKCRSGKTFISGKLIVELKKDRTKFTSLIITPAPTETSPQFTDELFNRYREFAGCQIIQLNGKNVNNIKSLLKEKNIIVASKQFLQQYTDKNKIELPKINLIIFDENHFSGTTNLSKQILLSYASKNTIKVYLTATYNKPLKTWDVLTECQMYWDIEDEQFCKQQNIKALIDKHGKEVETIIEELKQSQLSQDEIFIQYNNYPDLQFITNLFDYERYQIIKENIMDSKYGFSFDTLFSLTKNKKSFQYEKEVEQILRYISGSQKEIDFKNGDKSILGRINKICAEADSRKCLTQLWFLPVQNINEISTCLKKIMEKDKILNKYEIIIFNSKLERKIIDIKAEILKTEKIALATGKLGTIILVGCMLTLGITLSNCDIVMLLNNTLSSDKIMQMMYRCMSESNKKDKKYGFVVDLNISRVIHTCITYNIYKKDMNIENKIKYLIENHLINIDADYLDNKKIDVNKIVSKLLDMWKEDPINNLKTMLRQIENDIISLELSDQKILNEYFTANKDRKIDIEIEVKNDDDNQELPDGKEKIINTDTIEEEHKEEKISFTKDVLPFIVPLSCILTINDKNKDFIGMLNTIKKNEDLLEVFDDQSYIWWNKTDIIEIVKKLVSKYVEKNSLTYNVSVNFKLSLQSLIDKPKELLELIDSCLKPKQEEKKKFGEVFTPMTLVNEMLDRLDKCYIKEYNKSIFEEDKYKWFDPANGMGNFPIAVYLRLMEGLKNIIKDDKQRKKHILENMLYMSELNKKNVYICKQIFDINNEHKLNLHNGDSLKLDTKKEWMIKNFDVIMGNPPYQPDSNGKKGGKSIWPLFVKYSMQNLKKNKYLVFVHPALWRKPENKLRDIFFTKQIKYLSIHNDIDGMKIFGATTRFDWYIIQNKQINEEAIINFEDKQTHKVMINDKLNCIPNFGWSIWNKVMLQQEIIGSLKACGDSMCHTSRDYVSSTKNNEYKYELINSISETNGITYKYSKKAHPMQNHKKVIFSNGRKIVPIYDNGKYGVTQGGLYICVDTDEEGEKIKEYLNSNLIQFLIKSTKWSNFETIKQIFWNIAHPKKINDTTDQNIINKYFNLTADEIISITKK